MPYSGPLTPYNPRRYWPWSAATGQQLRPIDQPETFQQVRLSHGFPPIRGPALNLPGPWAHGGYESLQVRIDMEGRNMGVGDDE